MIKGLVASLSIGSVLGLSAFGPKHCVSVFKNEQTGTCVIQTNCNGLNLDDVEFAFTCQLPNMLQKHSFGKGGFDAVETFDTSVKCNECGIPAEVTMSLEKQQAALVKKAPSVMAEDKADKGKVTYGPSGCISTWLKTDSEKNEDGEKGVCMVETKCGDVADDVFGEYPMGLVCVDKDNLPTRHLFGTNSFDKSESFDTLIRCTTCLGLDKVSESITLQSTVATLAKEVYDIKKEVYKLEKKNGVYVTKDGEEAKKPEPEKKEEEATTEKAEEAAAEPEAEKKEETTEETTEAATTELSEKKRTNLRGSDSSNDEESTDDSEEQQESSEESED